VVEIVFAGWSERWTCCSVSMERVSAMMLLRGFRWRGGSRGHATFGVPGVFVGAAAEVMTRAMCLR